MSKTEKPKVINKEGRSMSLFRVKVGVLSLSVTGAIMVALLLVLTFTGKPPDPNADGSYDSTWDQFRATGKFASRTIPPPSTGNTLAEDLPVLPPPPEVVPLPAPVAVAVVQPPVLVETPKDCIVAAKAITMPILVFADKYRCEYKELVSLPQPMLCIGDMGCVVISKAQLTPR